MLRVLFLQLPFSRPVKENTWHALTILNFAQSLNKNKTRRRACQKTPETNT